MNVGAKLGGFVLALGVVFAAAHGAGALMGPTGGTERGAHEIRADDEAGHGPASDHHGPAGDQSAEEAPASGPGGLAVSIEGFTLRPAGAPPIAGVPGEFAFQIVDAHQTPVTRFRTSHDKQLHLIVARRDLTGFQHLHPQMSPDGTWRTPLTLPVAGQWRAFADFLPEGRDRQVILGVDVPVSGDYRPEPLPAPAATATVDGYTIAVDGRLLAGRTSRLTLTLSKDGAPVTDLQPYLGPYGHLVALRAGDLAYLHVHPQQTTSAGPTITLDVEVPTAVKYRLFLDFQHGGVRRTASVTTTAA